MVPPIRIGLLGLGRHGSRYLRHLAQGDVAELTLTHVWTRDPDKRARVAAEHGVTAVDRLEAVPEAVDAVIAAVPAGLHREVARVCAAHRRPLLLEKPLARTVPEGQAIVEDMKAAGALLMVAQTLRFDPLLLALRRRRGELGRIVGLSFEQRLEPRGLAWEDDPEVAGGGVLAQTAIHTLDAARFVTEAAAGQVLAASTDRVVHARTEDVGLVHLALEGGPALERPIVGDVRVSKIGASRHMRFALFGERGGLEADFVERALYRTVDRERTKETIPESPTVPSAAQAFANALLGVADNPVPGEDALASLALVEGAYRLAQR